MTFNNFPRGAAKGFNAIVTRPDNVKEKKYHYDPESDPSIVALDITWCDAQLPNSSDTGGNKSISTTEDLLTLINEMNKRLYVLTAAVIALSNK
jgi:hypothetical protein